LDHGEEVGGELVVTGGDTAEALNHDENRAEAADLIRSLVDRITLTPNAEGKLDIDLYGDLASILSLAAQKERPLDESDPSVVQVKMVAGARYPLYRNCRILMISWK
jgi:hypothetical protein